MTEKNVDIDLERAKIEQNFSRLINRVEGTLVRDAGERTDIVTTKNDFYPKLNYTVHEVSYDYSGFKYDKAIIVDNEVTGRIKLSINSNQGIKISMPDETYEFNRDNFSDGLIPSLINLGKILEYRRNQEKNLEAIRTKYLEDAEDKVNALMEEIENGTPEEIAKALEELNK